MSEGTANATPQCAGPEDGHTFRFWFDVRGSSKGVGDPKHTDAPDFMGPVHEIRVRAWNLRGALRTAADLPFNVLMGTEVTDGALTVGAADAYATANPPEFGEGLGTSAPADPPKPSAAPRAARSCVLCGHSKHGLTDCGAVVGYDHLNGDHECGCPGDDLHKDPWMMRRIGHALDAIRHADSEGLETELDLLAFAEDVLRQYANPSSTGDTDA